MAELSRLARTVRAWQAEILAFHATDGCSNGPTEASNLLIKKVSASGTVSATSPTVGCGCCTAASPGRLTGPHDWEAAHHVCYCIASTWPARGRGDREPSPRAAHPSRTAKGRLTRAHLEPS
jgi:hypothetical protein